MKKLAYLTGILALFFCVISTAQSGTEKQQKPLSTATATTISVPQPSQDEQKMSKAEKIGIAVIATVAVGLFLINIILTVRKHRRINQSMRGALAAAHFIGTSQDLREARQGLKLYDALKIEAPVS